MTCRLLALALCAFVASGVRAGDWPQWRGPDHTGVSKETGLLKAWPKDGPKLLWTYKNAGAGHSSCAVVGATYYTLGTRDNDEVVIALDVQAGKELWTSVIGPIYKAETDHGHGPRSTPTVDGKHLYVLGSQGDLVCYDRTAKGKELWRKNLPKDFGGVMMTDWGYSESPLVDGPQLICTPGGEKGTLVALDKKDGKLIWQSTQLKNKAPYSTIMPAVIQGERQYIQHSYDEVGGYVSGVAAKDGKVLWSAPIFKGSSYFIATTPIVKDNLVYVSSNNTVAGCHCFEIDAKFVAKDLYKKPNQKVMKNNFGGVLLIGDYVYGFGDNLGWLCQELKTGDKMWDENEKLKGRSGALTAAEGLLYVLSDSGEVGLLEANPKEFKEISSFQLPEKSKLPQTLATSKNSLIWAHPAIANGRLYLRDHDLIFCFDVKGK